MLWSLVKGFAAIAKHEGRNADFVTFHKMEAVPKGRKVDPYLRGNDGSPDDQSTWQDELDTCRAAIQSLIDGTGPPVELDVYDWLFSGVQ
jgi:hypothetical protein